MRSTFLSIIFLCSVLSFYAQSLSIENLRCEYKTNPIGIDEMQPRFSWEIRADERNVMQTAYRIRVAKNPKDLKGGKNLSWDSGRIPTDQSIHVAMPGGQLESRQRYYWQLQVWDNRGLTFSSNQPAYFEMGLLEPSDWSAKWIEATWKENPKASQPAHLLRKEFETNKKIASARLYITAHGLYEAEINGKKISQDVFNPGWTSYNKRLQYQVYDVKDLLQKGKNAISVMLGDGWYRGFIGFRGQRNFYGDKLCLLFQLEITYTNGKQTNIVSDKSWKASKGPIVWSDIYNGEVYDANLEKTGWEQSGFNDKSWSPVKEVDYSFENLIATASPPIRPQEQLKPIALIKTPNGETVLDFGQNLVGRVRFKVSGNQGDTIKIWHAEVLDEEGNFYTENLRFAKQYLEYSLKGGSEENYEPCFTFMGFRYIKVEGWPGTLNPEDFTAIVIHSEMPVTGDFECSDTLINQLQKNILWGQKGNFLDVPTDCPQRDERLGWTGDAQAFSRTAAFNMDVASFMTKWMGDFGVDQRDDGMIPYVIPHVLGRNAGAATGWADAVTIIPWNMYLAYGDKRILKDNYEAMKKWVAYMEEKAGDDFLWDTGFHFGDWLFYSRNDDRDGKSAITDKYFLAQAFFAYSSDLVQRTAQVLGEYEDAKYYKELSEKVQKVFLEEYVTPNGRVGTGTQTSYVLSLNFDLLPDDKRAQAAERLVKNIEQYQDHITTGFLGTPHINHVLTRFGHLDKAYTLLEQKTYPSWLYPVTKGATTIWERWDGIQPDGKLQNPSMNSFNHYAYGAIGDWMYRVVAGIDIDESQPGYKKIIIAPKPGGSLTYAKARHLSMYGKIESAWTLDDKRFNLDITIPPNTTAKVILPNTENINVLESGKPLKKENGILTIFRIGNTFELEVGSGSYSFSYDSKNFARYRVGFNLQNSIEEIMEHDEAYLVLTKYLPELKDHPKLKSFQHMTIGEAADKFIILLPAEDLKKLSNELAKIKR